MNARVSDRVSVTTNPSFRDRFVAARLLIRYRRASIIFHMAYPLFGIFLLMTPLLGYRLGPIEILLAFFCFSFTPLTIALCVWLARRQNKLAHGPVTCIFDSEGMHTSGPAFTQTIRWSGIPRVRRINGFLFVFIAPARAYCIPLRDLTHPDDLDRLLALAAQYTSSQ